MACILAEPRLDYHFHGQHRDTPWHRYHRYSRLLMRLLDRLRHQEPDIRTLRRIRAIREAQHRLSTMQWWIEETDGPDRLPPA